MSITSTSHLAGRVVEAQRHLFQLLPEVETAIGARLTESLLMVLIKSVSGIYFQTEVFFLTASYAGRENARAGKHAMIKIWQENTGL